MGNRQINFYIAALLITVIGAGATIAITRVAEHANDSAFIYNSDYFAPANGTTPSAPAKTH